VVFCFFFVIQKRIYMIINVEHIIRLCYNINTVILIYFEKEKGGKL